jgi:hypothetical protein
MQQKGADRIRSGVREPIEVHPREVPETSQNNTAHPVEGRNKETNLGAVAVSGENIQSASHGVPCLEGILMLT